MKLTVVIVFSFILTIFHSNAFNLAKQLSPVHGLFIKPSEDGVTGDLYVAASEDNGVNSQWLTDHPVNLLPKSASKSQAASVPVTYTSSITSSTSPHEETVTTQKRAVITSPPVKYAYAIPAATDGNPMLPYSYGYYSPNLRSPDENGQCQTEGITASPTLPAYPYPYYYPHMLTALSAAMNALKDNEGEDKCRENVSHYPPHGWPASYAYPYQYVMVEPRAWPHTGNSATGSNKSIPETEQE